MILVINCNVFYGQWTYKLIKSDFDGEFKKAYTAINNGGFLAMEEGEEKSVVIKFNQKDNVPFFDYQYECCILDFPKYKYIINDTNPLCI
jgi:hypothetical protein